MRPSIARSPMPFFFGLAYLLSWGYWLGLLAAGRRVGPGSATTHLPGLLGPLLAAFLVTALWQGRPGVVDLLRRTTRLGQRPAVGLLLALSPLLLGALTFLALAALGQPLPPWSAFATYPGSPPELSAPFVIVMVLIVNGFGEEVGWRGFAIHHLSERLGRLRATLVVAGGWALWHAPLFVLTSNLRALVGPALIGWLIGLVLGAFVLSWLYLRTRSVLLVAIWHTGFNLTTATDAADGTPAAVVSTLVMIWGAAIAIRWSRDRRRPSTR